MAIKRVSLAEVARLMKAGFVRFKKDDDGNGVGNIEEELGLSPAALKEIYANDKIKGIRIKVPTYVLIDDYNPENDTVELIDDIDNTETTSNEIQNTVLSVNSATEPEPITAELDAILSLAERDEAELFD